MHIVDLVHDVFRRFRISRCFRINVIGSEASEKHFGSTAGSGVASWGVQGGLREASWEVLGCPGGVRGMFWESLGRSWSDLGGTFKAGRLRIVL